MNIVLPATLMLDWWDELLRVAGSLKLGWVTASLVIANNRPSTLPPRRGTRPSGQLPQSGHQRGHGVKYRLYGRSRGVTQRVFRRSVVRCLGEAWERAWAIEFIPIIAAVATASHARERCAAFQHTSMTRLRTPAFRRG